MSWWQAAMTGCVWRVWAAGPEDAAHVLRLHLGFVPRGLYWKRVEAPPPG